jgi:hypothetical protein
MHPQRVILFFSVACGNQVNVQLALHRILSAFMTSGGECDKTQNQRRS